MAVDLNQLQADDAAYAKQAATARAAQQSQAEEAKQPPTLMSLGTAERGHVTGSMIDSIVNEIEQWGTAAKRVGQDVAAGVTTAAANIGDAVNPANAMNAGIEQLQKHFGKDGTPFRYDMPIWDHAKSSIMGFRDAVAVKDPNAVDSVTQAGAQLIAPFAAYSKALAGLQGFANTAAAGALTDVTALQPHDMRTADLIALGRETDTKIGKVLREIGPYGLNAYVNFLADRGNETEAEGRFKNALDGLGANAIVTPLLHAAGIVVKQGYAGTRFMLENGVGSASGFGPVPRSLQEGKIVFHGSRHNFDEFDSSKIGTGEGSQAYGYGLYFAEDPRVAGSYTGRVGEGPLYHVDIPDQHIANMIDYDAPIAQQPPVVQKAFKDAGILDEDDPRLKTGADAYYKFAKQLASPQMNGERAASARLNDAGVPGISFLDQLSREPRLFDTSGKPYPIKGYAAEQAMFLVKQQGSVAKALRAAERRGWNEGFYQDKEKYDALKEFQAHGLELKQTGTRNIVLFDAKHAKIVKKE